MSTLKRTIKRTKSLAEYRAESQRVACPYCGAAAGKPCRKPRARTPLGFRRASRNHDARVWASLAVRA